MHFNNQTVHSISLSDKSNLLTINKTEMIIILTAKADWDHYIETFEDADFYHTYDYHQLSKKQNEVPILIKYENHGYCIAMPLLIRDIAGSGYRDATSVYGYCGPLSRISSGKFDNKDFSSALRNFLVDNRIITVFSRLNPFVRQDHILSGMGQITLGGEIVNIDLSTSPESQKNAYHKRLKTYINKSRREMDICPARSNEEILRFVELYYETMWRVGAEEKYYFPKQYFFDLLNSTDFKAEILLARDKQTQEIMGGVLFVIKKRTVHYHLSGTSEKFLRASPVKLLIDEMRLRAHKKGLVHFNLGGGVNGRKDSLFYFKSGFSRDYKPFKLWKFIVDIEAYEKLVAEKSIHNNINEKCLEYFPLYRCEVLDSPW